MTNITPGVYCLVEGMDGCGKTEAVKILSTALKLLGKDVLQTFEMGSTPISMELRKICFSKRESEVLDPVSRMLLIYASRLQHLKTVVYPATLAGKYVICDRGVPSTKVYQARIDGLEEMMYGLNRIEELKITAVAPDILVYLDVDPQVAYDRGVARTDVDNDVYKNDLEKAKRIKAAYDRVIQDHRDKNDTFVFVIDANQPLIDVQNDLVELAKAITSQPFYDHLVV